MPLMAWTLQISRTLSQVIFAIASKESDFTPVL